MIAHTKAFASYRKLSQGHLNFVVLVCSAVPALRADLATPGANLTHTPDHFKSQPELKNQVKEYEKHYKEDLGRATAITTFSYFESYVREVVEEIVDYHGGQKPFVQMARDRAGATMDRLPASSQASKRKLQEYGESGKRFKYQNHSKILDETGFRFPTELMAHYGALQLVKKMTEKHGFRAWEIPDILESALLFPIEATQKELFDELRSLRNKVAHGKPATVDFAQGMQWAKALHALAAKVDAHVLEHFFVVQKYLR